jgi:hypothetical protein
MTKFALSVLAIVSLAGSAAAAVKTTGVSVGGVNAALLTPDKAKGAIILMAGGNGQIGVGSDGSIAKQGNQLVRTRGAYAARGFAVLVPDAGVNVAAAVKMMSKFGPVTLVGTSRGTQRSARGIVNGAKPSRLVLTAGFLSNASGDTDNVVNILGRPDLLPPTLVVHHKSDQCKKTRPAGVRPFIAWSKGRANVVWLSGGSARGNPCQARHYHGFNGIDGQVVDAVVKFAGQ